MSKFYSHVSTDQSLEVAEVVAKIKNRVIAEGDTAFATVKEKLNVLEGLSRFELGRYFILNQGLDGHWSHYIAYEFPRLAEEAKPKNPMERMLFEVLGDFELRVRLDMAQAIIQKELRENISILSVPCGIMAVLSSLDFSKIKDFKLYGVDLDPKVLDAARNFAATLGVETHCEFACKDAWDLRLDNQFDIALTMGLNVFISDRKKVVDLYKSLYGALKPGGKALVSFMTPYSFRDPHTERDLSSLDPAAVKLQRMVVTELVQSRVVNFCSSEEIKKQLGEAGFSKIEIQYSKCKSPNIAIGLK